MNLPESNAGNITLEMLQRAFSGAMFTDARCVLLFDSENIDALSQQIFKDGKPFWLEEVEVESLCVGEMK